jgi:phage portal protein BeeE
VSLLRRRPADRRPSNLAPTSVGTTYGDKTPTEPIPDNFAGYVSSCFRGNGIVAAVEDVRLNVFAEARFQWQALNSGTPGKLFGTPELALLEQPWPGGTTGDLLTRMILDADFAGNAYVARIGNELVRLRPDWVDIVLAPRMAPFGPGKADTQVGYTRVGYAYWEDGKRHRDKPAAIFLPSEVAHFAPKPDPLATFRGMSWLTPVIREIQADQHTVTHKLKFFENNASVNLAVVAKENLSVEQFNDWVDSMDRAHSGVRNAYKTLYLSAGADVTPVGSTMQQMDFANTQGAGEVRIANAAGIHPVVIGLVTALGGSSLNAGNYGAAKRSTVDRTFRPLWRNVCGSPAGDPQGTARWADAALDRRLRHRVPPG